MKGMKKKVLALVLVVAMILTNAILVSAQETGTTNRISAFTFGTDLEHTSVTFLANANLNANEKLVVSFFDSITGGAQVRTAELCPSGGNYQYQVTVSNLENGNYTVKSLEIVEEGQDNSEVTVEICTTVDGYENSIPCFIIGGSQAPVSPENCPHINTHRERKDEIWTETGGFRIYGIVCDACRTETSEERVELIGFTLHGYGPKLEVTIYDNGTVQEKRLDMNTTIEATGQTVGEQIDGLWSYNGTPKKEGATFEGWAKFYWENDEYGNTTAVFQEKDENDPYYTLSEVMDETLTRSAAYAAKWSDVPIEKYFNYYEMSIYPYGEGCMMPYDEYTWNQQTDQMDWMENSSNTPVWYSVIAGLVVEPQMDLNYRFVKDPTRSGAKFEGWAMFRVDYETGDYTFVPQSDTKPYYTTAEMMNVEAPEYHFYFVPKWDDMSITEYFPETRDFYFDMNGGEIAVSYTWNDNGVEKPDSYTSQLDWFEITEGMSVEKTLSEGKFVIAGFNKSGEVLKDWTIYKFESSEELYLEEGETVPKTDAENLVRLIAEYETEEGKFDVYIILKGYELVKNSVSTEQLLETMPYTNYYAIANWEKSVALKEDTKLTESVSKEGTAILDTIKDEKEIKESVVSKETVDRIKIALENDVKVETKLVVYPMDETIVNEKEKIELTKEAVKELGKDAKIQYLDIQVIFTAKEEVLGNLYELQKEVEITVSIPEGMKSANGKYVVVRNHNGEIDVLPTTINADGTITFKTDRFSTYALAYVGEEKTEPESGPAGTNPGTLGTGETGSTSTSTSSPKTGDNNMLFGYTLACVVALAVVVVLKKRESYI